MCFSVNHNVNFTLKLFTSKGSHELMACVGEILRPFEILMFFNRINFSEKSLRMHQHRDVDKKKNKSGMNSYNSRQPSSLCVSLNYSTDCIIK